MNTRKKLQTIARVLDSTQSELSARLGVSLVTLNNWWNCKVDPRPKMQAKIDDLYREVTGQKTVPAAELSVLKQALAKKSSKRRHVLRRILDNPDIHDEFVLQLTYHSNSIEGNTLTQPDTAAILFDGLTMSNYTLVEHLEARNHQAAFDFLLDHLAAGGPIDEDFVLRLHARLMNGILREAGRYRRHAVRLLGVPLPTANPASVPQKIAAVIARAADPGGDVIAAATAVHAEFERIHPFADGNGRVGRLLLAAMLLRADLPPAIIRREQKQLYYAFLYRAQTSDDQSALERFFCEVVGGGFEILR